VSEWREKAKKLEGAPYSYRYAELHELIDETKGMDPALLVAIDHITDVGNFGAIVRSAEVVGASGIIIPKRRSVTVNEAVFRTSAGAIEYMRVAAVANIAESLKRLQQVGFWAGAATEHAETDIWDAPLSGRLVLVLGSEEDGVSRLVRQTCDFEFKLPQQGFTQSLNVAQAATAIMYEWLRRTIKVES